MNLRWLVLGATGMVGSDVVNELKSLGESVIAVGRSTLDITDSDAVRRLVDTVRPSIIVNCAAYTKVDAAEEHESAALAVNGTAVATLASLANRYDALLTQISTDFVFDGEETTPYQVNHPTSPLSAYGRTKLIGEKSASSAEMHLVIRTSWLFGEHGTNFVEAILRQLEAGKSELRVVADQLGRPTYTPHLAAVIIRLSRRAFESAEARGVVHYADSPGCSWFDFATKIVEISQRLAQLEREVTVLPVTSDAFPRPARRPAYSVLSTERYERLTDLEPQSWEEGLQEYLLFREAAAEQRV